MQNRIQNLTLSNGVQIPQLGLGVFRAGSGRETVDAIHWALDAGYRHIDTAAVYGNEDSVGQALASCGLPREDIFVTTKVWNDDIRLGRTRMAFEESLDRLGLDYVDLYLLHWPVAGGAAAWKVLEDLYDKGRVRAIGVSNYHIHHLESLMATARIVPMMDQVESHPLMNNQALIDYCQAHGIAVGAWSPLGGPNVQLTRHPHIMELAKKYGRTEAQIILRWDIQRGIYVIPKSSHRERIIANSQIFDFSLEPQDMELLGYLNMNFRVGPDPDNFDF